MNRATAIQNAVKKRGAVKHVGFEGAESNVEREGYSKKVAAKIIGAASHNASAAARARNPRLARVK